MLKKIKLILVSFFHLRVIFQPFLIVLLTNFDIENENNNHQIMKIEKNFYEMFNSHK